ncbi:TPA: flavodoxin family protein [Thermoplasmata archaeon]|nr:flavodoxin family protein [Thermoplasmata archaeon]
MRRAAIVYESKFGNTAKVAEAVADALRSSGFDEVRSETVESADVNKVATYKVIFVGSPNHMGGPTRRIRKLLRSLAAFDLSDRRVCFFDTYIGGDFEKAVGKMHNEFRARNDTADIIPPGLSLRVEGMKGPLAEGELAKVTDFVRAAIGGEG